MQVVERAIARIAGGQENVISREQLLGAGLGRGALAHRIKAGTMQRLHTNVYLLGAAPPTPMARAWAAALACGADAVVSHRSAACLFGLLPDLGGDIDVTVVARSQWPRSGIRIHRVAKLTRQDVTNLNGLRTTTIARTICDVAATESATDTTIAFQEALYRRVVTIPGLEAVLAREPTRRGSPAVRSLIDEPRLTRSEKERLTLKLIKAAQLPPPATNVRPHGFLVDMFWPSERLVLEFDGWRGHGHRLAFERDRKRDQILLAAGLRVLRVTDRQLIHEPIAVAARIAMALNAGI